MLLVPFSRLTKNDVFCRLYITIREEAIKIKLKI